MAVEVFLPRLTHDMQSGVLVEWFKSEGDEVRKGEPLFAVETDKATVEVEAEASGLLRGIACQPGDDVPVGASMAWIADSGENVPLRKPATRQREVPPPDEVVPTLPAHGTEASIPAPQADDRVVASPLAKRIAREKGIDLHKVTGRGPDGRITQADVLSFVDRQRRPDPDRPSVTPLQPGLSEAIPFEVPPLPQLRRTTEDRLAASMRNAPHLDLEVEVDMGEAALWREQCSRHSGEPASYTALFVRVIARALRSHPQVNAAFHDGELRLFREINIAVATVTSAGPMVPVIWRADRLTLDQIQSALNELRKKGESMRFAADDVSNPTFTLSNLGMYGVDAFRAITNRPQAAILTVGRIAERPAVRDGTLQVRPTARLILSVDHRVLGAAQAAAFLTEVRRLLEHPYLLL